MFSLPLALQRKQLSILRYECSQGDSALGLRAFILCVCVRVCVCGLNLLRTLYIYRRSCGHDHKHNTVSSLKVQHVKGTAFEKKKKKEEEKRRRGLFTSLRHFRCRLTDIYETLQDNNLFRTLHVHEYQYRLSWTTFKITGENGQK